VAIGGRQQDAALAAPLDRFGGVLDQVQQDLCQRIRIDQRRRQRGVEALVDRDLTRKSRARDAAYVVEQRIDVMRLQMERPRIGKVLHAVDQRRDTIDLGGDERRQRCRAARIAQQLRGPADPRQGVLDFVRQHRRRPQHRFAPRRAWTIIMAQLRQGHHAPPRIIGQRRGGEVDTHAVSTHRDRQIAHHQSGLFAGQARLDARVEWADAVGQARADKSHRTGAQKVLGGVIDLCDQTFAVNQHHREDQARKLGACIGTPLAMRFCGDRRHAQAACCIRNGA